MRSDRKRNRGFSYLKFQRGGRSQDGGGIGETTFSPTNSLKEQLNAEQTSQNNFWSLAEDIRRLKFQR